RLAKPFLCFSLSSVYRKKSIIRLGMLFNIRIMLPPFFCLLLFVSICLFRRFFYLFYRVLCFRGLLVYTLAFFILTVWLLFSGLFSCLFFLVGRFCVCFCFSLALYF